MDLLITLSDFTGLVDVSSNINAERRVNTHIKNAQKFDLGLMLGEALLYEFIKYIKSYNDEIASNPAHTATPTEQKYLDLLNGKIYKLNGNDVAFEGVKPALVYYSHARILVNQNIHTTATNIAKKLNQYSETAEEKEIIRLKTDAESVAWGYMNDVKTFLNANKSLYPLWLKSCHCESKIKRSGARITAVYNG
ncbi:MULTISPECIES: DUF6712 family protein [Olivibacter]|uniref:Uncharacterized protein n=1 Tax=Olivibacter jilunii TaxID=985016 RepID=A0ABW6B0N2_9SPHI